MNRLLTIALGCALVVAASACGSDDDGDSDVSPTVALSVTVATPGVPIQGVSTPAGGEATVIATQYTLETYRHEAAPRRQGTDVIDFPYEILFPVGWQVEGAGITLTSAIPRPDKFPYASISVDCRPGVNMSQMLATDGAATGSLDLGDLGSAPVQSYTVAGQEAIRVDWNGGGAFPAGHTSVYVDGKDCAWRLQLNTFGGIRPADLSALFFAIVDAFDPTQGLP